MRPDNSEILLAQIFLLKQTNKQTKSLMLGYLNKTTSLPLPSWTHWSCTGNHITRAKRHFLLPACRRGGLPACFPRKWKRAPGFSTTAGTRLRALCVAQKWSAGVEGLPHKHSKGLHVLQSRRDWKPTLVQERKDRGNCRVKRWEALKTEWMEQRETAASSREHVQSNHGSLHWSNAQAPGNRVPGRLAGLRAQR